MRETYIGIQNRDESLSFIFRCRYDITFWCYARDKPKVWEAAYDHYTKRLMVLLWTVKKGYCSLRLNSVNNMMSTLIGENFWAAYIDAISARALAHQHL